MNKLFLVLLFFGFIDADQTSIERVEQMPNFPQPYLMRDWQETAINYDNFIFDFNQSGEYLPLIWWNENTTNYPEHNSFGLHTVVGTTSPNSSEAINLLAAVVGASLSGVDKSSQEGNDYVLMCEEYFNNRPEENVYLNHPVTSSGNDWWYDTIPNILFYQLYDLYPDTGQFNSQFESVADRWLEAIEAMGGGTTPWQIPFMDYRGWYLETMTANNSGVHEPEAAGALAWIQYNAYIKSGNESYRIGAELAMDFLDNLESNPSYELQLSYGAFTAARMNVELNTNYDLDKILNWCFDTGPLRNWGAIVGTWGDYDCSGLIGQTTQFYGYAFLMNTFQQVGALVPMVRYADQYARAIGKWVLNAANASRLFYSQYLPDGNQDSENWSQQYDPQSLIGYEGLRQSYWGSSPFATGDAISGDWGETNLALYGSSHVGILGGIIDTTNIEGILKLDVNKTDYFSDNSFPTYLFYNPHESMHTVIFDVGQEVHDVYDAVNNELLGTNISGEYPLQIPSDNAILLVVIPAGSILEYNLNKLMVEGIVVDHSSGLTVNNYPPRIRSLSTAEDLVFPETQVTVYCTAADRDGDQVSYIWAADSGTISGSGESVLWTLPENEGIYSIECMVSDPSSDSDSSAISIEVSDLINEAPGILQITASPRKLHLTMFTNLSCDAYDPDSESLQYNWSAEAGEIMSDGSNASWQAPSEPGNYWLYCLVIDGYGESAIDSLKVSVRNFLESQQGNLIAGYEFSGNANDISGNDFHGLVYGPALTTDQFGYPASAYYFDGINDYIRIDNDPGLNFQNAISVSLWMNIHQFYDREAYPISHGNWENRWKLSVTTSGIRWTIKTDSPQNSGIIDLDSETVLQEDTFVFITAVYSGSDMEIYVDGELNSFTDWSGQLQQTFYDLTIGQVLPGNSNYNFNGVLDQIHIYDYALPLQEIEALHSGEVCHILADMNCDGYLDVLDIVITADFILSDIEMTNYQMIVGDLNNEDTIDIIDIIMMITMILQSD
ncbi:MAG: laminin G [Candidatus Marinimicrobia bacterium]|nr:laminin G [Candidatus Neomarinimicrobiota bacterium]MBT4852846.1 laminin G [Candidatus Neomarinimicrobiota bacterium]MBT6217663.1 laminin G [Candidatus Neomarinimicrobiota bacterium]